MEKETEEKEKLVEGKEKEEDKIFAEHKLDEQALKDLERKERELEELFDKMKVTTPGTPLRQALDDISKAGLGGLIVIGNSNNVTKIISGGFKINCDFSSQKLVELCKMDGAIILSDKLDKIVYCNTLLLPEASVETVETGMRHIAAERTAKQTGRLVIAISQKRKTISLYFKNIKYTLRSSEEILSKAVETVRMLEKHREILNELLTNLNILEFTNLTNLNDIVLPIQRIEIMSRIVEIIKKYITELGVEGNLVKILVKEMVKDLDVERTLLIKDYSRNWEFTRTSLTTLTLDELTEVDNITRALLYSSPSDTVVSRGYRLLSKTSLKKDIIKLIINHFRTLQDVLNAKQDKIIEVIGKKDTIKFSKEISSIREQALLGKKI